MTKSSYRPEQGDIVWLNFGTQSGHEQRGRLPAVIISNNTANRLFNTRAIVCPITSTNKNIPVQPPLDDRTAVQGVVLCDQVRTVDLASRNAEYIEKLPGDILHEVIDIVYGMIEEL
jgi:mRNA interferase MazF